ncbi:MAG: Hsp33 family molecular chaperone HslO [Solobacterium sp.]|nr:Hsp33 family molecular chaperone HslO [Solobacterium sp.]
MKDEIVIAEAMNQEVRIHAARSTDTVKAMQEAFDSSATCTAALGRVLTVTGLMASDLKRDEEHVRVRIRGNGPIGVVIAEGDGAGNVRGTADNMNLYASREDGHLDVGRIVGNSGTLQVAKDMGLREPFTGTVELASGEIGEDFARYFAVSEQTPSVVSVGVLVGTDSSVLAAGGMIAQLLPGASEETISALEKLAGSMRPMSEYMKEGYSAEELVKHLFSDAEILAKKPLRWHCGCSKEGFQRALLTLKKEDLRDMIEEDGGAEIVCRYCGKKYLFSKDDLEEILKTKTDVEHKKRND